MAAAAAWDCPRGPTRRAGPRPAAVVAAVAVAVAAVAAVVMDVMEVVEVVVGVVEEVMLTICCWTDAWERAGVS